MEKTTDQLLVQVLGEVASALWQANSVRSRPAGMELLNTICCYTCTRDVQGGTRSSGDQVATAILSAGLFPYVSADLSAEPSSIKCLRLLAFSPACLKVRITLHSFVLILPQGGMQCGPLWIFVDLCGHAALPRTQWFLFAGISCQRKVQA